MNEKAIAACSEWWAVEEWLSRCCLGSTRDWRWIRSSPGSAASLWRCHSGPAGRLCRIDRTGWAELSDPTDPPEAEPGRTEPGRRSPTAPPRTSPIERKPRPRRRPPERMSEKSFSRSYPPRRNSIRLVGFLAAFLITTVDSAGGPNLRSFRAGAPDSWRKWRICPRHRW